MNDPHEVLAALHKALEEFNRDNKWELQVVKPVSDQLAGISDDVASAALKIAEQKIADCKDDSRAYWEWICREIRTRGAHSA